MTYQPPQHPHENLDYHELLKRDYPSFPIRYRLEHHDNVTELRPIERTGTG